MKYLLTFALFFSTSLLAEQGNPSLPAVDPVSTGYLLKLTAGLVITVLFIFGLAWLMKKLQLTQHSQNGLIKIVSAISVGHRDRIALVQVGDEQILVGLTPGNMQKLHTLKNKVVPQTPEHTETQNFTEKFNQFVKKEPKRDR